MAEPLPGQLSFDGEVYRPKPKFLAFADVHLGNYDVPIRDSIVQVMSQIEWIAHMTRPDVILFGGDAFRHAVPSARDTSTFGHFLAALSKIAEVICVPGNHDIAGHDSTAIDVYDTLENVTVVKYPQILQRPTFQICCVPWLPSKALSTLDLEAQSTKGIIQAAMQLLKKQLDPNKYAIFLGHVTCLNASFNEKAYTILSDDVLWTQDMFEGFDVSILGHIHKPQEVHPGIYYTGSIHPTRFDEAGQDKFVIVGGQDVTYKELDTPPFIQINAEDLPEGFDAPGAYVKILKKHGDPDPEPPLSCAWYDIKPLPPERDFRQRLEEDEIDMEPVEALAKWLTLEGHDPEDVIKLAQQLMEAE